MFHYSNSALVYSVVHVFMLPSVLRLLVGYWLGHSGL